MDSAAPDRCLKQCELGMGVYLIAAYGRKTILTALIGFAFASLCLPTSGQSNPSSSIQHDFQGWDESDISAKLTNRLDLSWVSQVRFSARFPNPATYLSGIELNLSSGNHLVITPSYYYLALRDATGRHKHYQVPILAGTLKTTAGKWTLSDRNRFMGAIGDGDNFWFYLNRPKVDYRLGSRVPHTSVFLWDEVFYFSVFRGWTRNRLGVGARASINERLEAQLYYLRQDDLQVQPRMVNGLGLTFDFRVR